MDKFMLILINGGFSKLTSEYGRCAYVDKRISFSYTK